MNKLFQTLFVLLAMSSQTNAAPTKLHHNIDASKLLTFTQANRKNSDSDTPFPLLDMSYQANNEPAQLYSYSDADTLLPFTSAHLSSTYPKSLAGLYSINDYRSNSIKQPYSEFSQLYQHALTGQSELESLTERIALLSQTASFSSGIKSKPRALNKINTKLAGSSELITDLARSSIVAQDIPSLISAFELIEQETSVVRIKNRFKSPGASGYRDLSLLVRLPESQIIAEVQLHLEAFSVIKNGTEHHNYEQIQQIERLQLSENRALSELELAAVNKLRKESKQMYHYAWNQYLSA
ncbi:RelA/SpoT domain-containing protein [Psychromonas aquimarina]|uniref:RelA/SpoT domain-containing protein n=1 Tax=Psychromonas aquimarina TaxID=444919 RepID=UPI00040DAC0F|nr:RelA/SpoT domain-containing protein [Psychromonas aquimarina]